MFTPDVCVCVCVNVNVKRQEWVQTHSVHLCLRFHWCNVKLWRWRWCKCTRKRRVWTYLKKQISDSDHCENPRGKILPFIVNEFVKKSFMYYSDSSIIFNEAFWLIFSSSFPLLKLSLLRNSIFQMDFFLTITIPLLNDKKPNNSIPPESRLRLNEWNHAGIPGNQPTSQFSFRRETILHLAETSKNSHKCNSMILTGKNRKCVPKLILQRMVYTSMIW